MAKKIRVRTGFESARHPINIISSLKRELEKTAGSHGVSTSHYVAIALIYALRNPDFDAETFSELDQEYRKKKAEQKIEKLKAQYGIK